jgi:hypothetical protein
MKTYICLPYKDRQGKYKKALDSLLPDFKNYLKNNLDNFELFIVEQEEGKQLENDTLFNLGRTINIGYDLIKSKATEEDAYIWWPVDLQPIDTNFKISKTTKFHADHNRWYRALGFIIKYFKTINGFSNFYWGWGFEDEDMLLRLEVKQIDHELRVNDYSVLASNCNNADGTVTTSPENSELYHRMISERNCEISGLNDLKYTLVREEEYQEVKKYLVI